MAEEVLNLQLVSVQVDETDEVDECDLVHSVQTVAVTGVLLVGKIVNSFKL
ncbi:Uncharacterised protein [Streptococcus pneumoniae]|nr:Uncharacterised protein [Streptococcus pneumoniae]